MPNYLESKPEPLNWQAITTAKIAPVKAAARAFLEKLVPPSDFKTQVVKDFFEIGYRNETYSKESRDTYIKKYIGQDRKLSLTMPVALQWLAEVMESNRQPLQAENIRYLLRLWKMSPIMKRSWIALQDKPMVNLHRVSA